MAKANKEINEFGAASAFPRLGFGKNFLPPVLIHKIVSDTVSSILNTIPVLDDIINI